MKKHTPEAQYNFTCEFCEKRFEKLDSVKFHKLKSHPDKQATWGVQTLVTGAEQVQVGPPKKNQREASSDETDFPLLCLSYLSCPGWCEPVTTQAVSEGKGPSVSCAGHKLFQSKAAKQWVWTYVVQREKKTLSTVDWWCPIDRSLNPTPKQLN